MQTFIIKINIKKSGILFPLKGHLWQQKRTFAPKSVVHFWLREAKARPKWRPRCSQWSKHQWSHSSHGPQKCSRCVAREIGKPTRRSKRWCPRRTAEMGWTPRSLDMERSVGICPSSLLVVMAVTHNYSRFSSTFMNKKSTINYYIIQTGSYYMFT